MAKFHIIIGLVVCFIVWTFFLIFPNLDITIANHFFNFSNQEFVGRSYSVLVLLNLFARNFPIFFSIIVILFLCASLFVGAFRIKSRKEILFVAVCLWVGPGLVVNYIFKDHWGRPRPAMVQQFGGDKIFKQPFVISSQCDRNCSFVCGDASLGFWLFAFMPLLSTRKKMICSFIVAAIAGGSLGLMRISQGGHFFSDVVFCGIFVYICTWTVYWLMYERKKE